MSRASRRRDSHRAPSGRTRGRDRAGRLGRWFDARVDGQNTSFLGLPDNANAPAPAGLQGGNFVKVSDLNFDKVLCGTVFGAPGPC